MLCRKVLGYRLNDLFGLSPVIFDYILGGVSLKSIHHSHWHTSVHIHGAESLLGRTTYLSTDLECAASLRVNVKSFGIEKARWEVYRGPDGPLSENIDRLAGVEAYLGSGSVLRQAITESYGTRALSIISETVRGIIQAETFVYRERGYDDAKSYDDYWEKMYIDTCRYYSNLERISQRWEDHISSQKRFNCLFNRFKSISVAEGDDCIFADASLSDSFHEVGLSITINRATGAATAVDCRLLRGPDPVCFESGSYAQNLLGQKVAAMSKKEIAGTMGGGQGCVHMIDVCSDLASVLRDLL